MSQSKIKRTEAETKEMQQTVVSERLKLAADTIRASRKIPDVMICDAIGDSAWFKEYMTVCLQSPIANAFLGCILFGWQLAEEYNKIENATGLVYRA